jgi:hypothetical protein
MTYFISQFFIELTYYFIIKESNYFIWRTKWLRIIKRIKVEMMGDSFVMWIIIILYFLV